MFEGNVWEMFLGKVVQRNGHDDADEQVDDGASDWNPTRRQLPSMAKHN